MANGTATPFKKESMNRLNDLAAKFDQPLFTLAYRVLTVVGAMFIAVGLYAWKSWLNDQIAKNPIVNNVGLRLETIERKGDERAVQVEEVAKTQVKIGEYLRKGLEAQQQTTVQLSVLVQKVDDNQRRAEDAEKRLDNRLDQLQRHN